MIRRILIALMLSAVGPAIADGDFPVGDFEFSNIQAFGCYALKEGAIGYASCDEDGYTSKVDWCPFTVLKRQGRDFHLRLNDAMSCLNEPETYLLLSVSESDSGIVMRRCRSEQEFNKLVSGRKDYYCSRFPTFRRVPPPPPKTTTSTDPVCLKYRELNSRRSGGWVKDPMLWIQAMATCPDPLVRSDAAIELSFWMGSNGVEPCTGTKDVVAQLDLVLKSLRDGTVAQQVVEFLGTNSSGIPLTCCMEGAAQARVLEALQQLKSTPPENPSYWNQGIPEKALSNIQQCQLAVH